MSLSQSWLASAGEGLQARYALAVNANGETTTSVGEALLLCKPLGGVDEILTGVDPDVRAMFSRLWIIDVHAIVSFRNDTQVKFTFQDIPFKGREYRICNYGHPTGTTTPLRDVNVINENWGYATIGYRYGDSYWRGRNNAVFSLNGGKATLLMDKELDYTSDTPPTSGSWTGESGVYDRCFLVGEDK